MPCENEAPCKCDLKQIVKPQSLPEGVGRSLITAASVCGALAYVPGGPGRQRFCSQFTDEETETQIEWLAHSFSQ